MRRLVPPLVLLVSLLLPSLAPAGEPLEELSGTWVLAERQETVRSRIDDAVEALMDRMDGVYAALRWVAGPRLRKGAKVCQRYELHVAGTEFTWRCDDDPPQERGLGGGAAPLIGDDGNIYEVRVARADSSVRMTSAGASGGERAEFQPAAGGMMVVKKAMYSPHLPDEVVWTMRYRRLR